MSLPSLLLLAIGLAMDATAVAGARGLLADEVRLRDALRVAAFFGGSQAIMPAIGWALGAAMVSHVGRWEHWVTFVVLGGIGAKMIHAAMTKIAGEPLRPTASVFGTKVLGLLALATSIDALGAGLTLGLGGGNVAWECSVIGAITAVLSFAGVYMGRRFGARVGNRLDVLGGVVLIGLAIKSVADHFFLRH